MPEGSFTTLQEFLDRKTRDDRERAQAEATRQRIRDNIREAEVFIASDEPLEPLSTPDPDVDDVLVRIDAELDRISTELDEINKEQNKAHIDRLDTADTLDDHTIKITALTNALGAAEKRMDKLRDRLFVHEQGTKRAIDGLSDFVDAQQDELTDLNGLDGNRIDNLSAAVDEHAQKLAAIYGKDLGRITAAENWIRAESDRTSSHAGDLRELTDRIDAIERKAVAASHDAESVRNLMCDIMNDAVNPLRRQVEALEQNTEEPGKLYKIQYRYGLGQWTDYAPDNGNYLSVSGDGRGLIQMRMVRK